VAAVIVNLKACGAAFIQQVPAISAGKALSNVPDEHKTGCVPAAGSVQVLGKTIGEAIPGENDGKITGRLKEKTR
jgi:hypothetical protein